MATDKNKTAGKGLHILFWLAVAAVWFYLRYQDYANLMQALSVTFIKVTDLALAIYMVNLVLVPAYLYKKKYLHFGLAFVGVIGVCSFLKWMVISTILARPTENVKEAVYNNFVTLFFLVLASIALKSAVDYIRLQKRLSDVAREKAEAELAFLKAQINPHFLFNSLNAVYFLIDKSNTEARNALHTFSEMLRYQLYECNGQRIPLEKEIGFLKEYVGLQRLRSAENTTVRFCCEDSVSQLTIEPLLLIPFVENSFKHLSHFAKEQQNEVRINVTGNASRVQFSVYNTTQPKPAPNESGGIGLANVKKRLQLLYPNRHQLQVKEESGWFGVELELSLHA